VIAGAAVCLLVAAVVYLGPAPRLGAPTRSTAGPGAAQLVSVSFLDAERGAVALYDPDRQAGATYLTADGGASWKRVSSGADSYGSVTFFDRAHIALQSFGQDRGYRMTEDGGASWRVVRPPGGSANALTFLDPGHGWYFGSSARVPQPMDLWRTVDGGRSWQPLGGRGIPLGGIRAAPFFLDGDRGVLAVTLVPGGWPVVLATPDGGDSWQPASLPSPFPGARPLGSGFVRDGLRLVAWFGVPAPEAEEGPDSRSVLFDRVFTVYSAVSQDGGATWSALTPGLTVRAYSLGLLGDGQGRLLLLDGRRLWVSSDAGRSWNARVAQVDERFQPMGLRAVAGAVLFAAAGTSRDGTAGAQLSPPQALLRSRDGGAHWEAVSLPRTSSQP
jgi:photosystem II stability/assembly factor-like uncharacterized protein